LLEKTEKRLTERISKRAAIALLVTIMGTNYTSLKRDEKLFCQENLTNLSFGWLRKIDKKEICVYLHSEL
jgi:hypothetical protein